MVPTGCAGVSWTTTLPRTYLSIRYTFKSIFVGVLQIPFSTVFDSTGGWRILGRPMNWHKMRHWLRLSKNRITPEILALEVLSKENVKSTYAEETMDRVAAMWPTIRAQHGATITRRIQMQFGPYISGTWGSWALPCQAWRLQTILCSTSADHGLWPSLFKNTMCLRGIRSSTGMPVIVEINWLESYSI